MDIHSKNGQLLGLENLDSTEFIFQFSCNGCSNEGVNVISSANVIVHDFDKPDCDEYILKTYPTIESHICLPCGVEKLSVKFHNEVISCLRQNPCQSIPALYKDIR